MKNFAIAMCLSGAFITGATPPPVQAQEPVTNPAPAPATPARGAPGDRAGVNPQINSPATTLNGLSLVAEITKSLNSKNARPGDEVKARVAQDLLLKGMIVLPRASQLIGHVVEVTARAKDSPEARLGIVFDRALLRNKKQIEMSAVLQALAPPITIAIDAQDPMIQQANDRAARMLPRLDSGVGSNRNMTDTSARSPQVNSKMSKDGNVTKEDPPTPWTPGARLDSGHRGVFGFPDLALATGSNKTPAITSLKNDIKLEGGTQIVLKVVSSVQ